MKRWGLMLVFFLMTGTALMGTSVEVEKGGIEFSRSRVVKLAQTMLGTPYRWAGITPRGVDCSGLVYYVYKNALDITLPRNVTTLFRTGTRVSEQQPGDLVFFDTMGGGSASHVGISLGGKRFIHAASAGRITGVIISSLDEKYYKTRYLGTARVLQNKIPMINIELTEQKLEKRIASPVSPGVPVFFNIKPRLDGEGYLVFRAYKKGQLVLTKRFRYYETNKIQELWFLPDSRNWTIQVAEENKGSLLLLDLHPEW